MPTPDPKTSPENLKNADSGHPILLFFPFENLPENANDLLGRLSEISGIQAGDLRYRLAGRGLTRLSPDPGPEKISQCVRQIQNMGLAAVQVPESAVRSRLRLPTARKVSIADSAVVFYDRQDNAVLTIDKKTDLLVIVADLSGKAVEKPNLSLFMEAGSAGRNFDQALKRISAAAPVAVICKINQEEPPAGVFVDHTRFSYPSMQNHMDLSAAVNFRNLMAIATKPAGSAVTDHFFGAARLPGAVPDYQSGQKKILTALNRYTRYMVAAARAGVFRQTRKPAGIAGFAGIPGLTRSGRAAQASENEQDFSTPHDSSSPREAKPKPPPEADSSGIRGYFANAPHEFIMGGVFVVMGVLWCFFNLQRFDHPVFWNTLAGVGLITAGLWLFFYSLVMLHYKRMVENTPTSRVRSMAMGTAELEGRARQYYDLRSPHSKTKCIYYWCTYLRRVRTSKGNKWRVEKIARSGALPFYLEDETGRILVRPRGALMLADKSRQEFWGGQGMWLAPDLRDRGTKIIETLIAEGARIYVLGAAGTERTGPAFRQRLIARLRALKSNPDALAQYDTNNDGRIDEHEWEAARTDMETRLHAESLAGGTSPGERPVIKKHKLAMMPFIIADSESAIIRKLALRTWLLLPGGLAVAGLGLQLLIRLYHG
ncbi:hypothetical protein HNR65_002998 [Desulfosalsimonas propionicica]|uniref:EF-hand domain-containing protein n=1 Tax=Desulfosalsimonas propionicica TaxID=332175 RepID=A0A7W0CBE7_9BACT|nr:hypothetical protein [Desulfosalsimonas propionicica]MBA2882644.1 hypothetical protein [Desulfosalsimonas propionicica]